MELRIFDMILGVLTILSLILAFISEEFRILAIIFAFVLMIVIIISIQNIKISSIILEHKKLQEKLKIHEHLIDIKVNTKILEKRLDTLEGKKKK